MVDKIPWDIMGLGINLYSVKGTSGGINRKMGDGSK